MYPNTFEEACAITGENPTGEKFSSGTSDEIALKKLKVITAAINKIDNDGNDWETNWDDRDEIKWYGWWDMEKDKNNPSGFRFFVSYCGRALTRIPARLCFKTEEGLQHSAEKFLDEWKAFMHIRK